MARFLFRSFCGPSRGAPVTYRAGGAASLAGLLILLGASPAAAVEMPFDPGPTLDELSTVAVPPPEMSETARLKAGILCVAWARDMIGQHWRLLDVLDGPGTWSIARQQLWLQVGWVEEFETRHLRPVIDAASQEDLLEAWWPGGVTTPAGSEGAIRMHRFCMGLPGLLGTVDPDAPPGF
ncbi:hypothetical protein [Rhodovulum euryhalinum]|uniref:Uncharacterized protein n=1 Tax=Rhodovulum euryhalinum TaxID=35805 RepID=A0A4R2KMW4_9RHOB|nr:hypothetical protein [Rhodovulum euryhalinum]TCO72109.1 hypothetical protein EV655_105217 [Rhodovulum euryhalinum]